MSYQVSIFLENKLGHLERVTAVLSAAGINIRSIHINHTANGWGILNLVVSDPERAQKLGRALTRPVATLTEGMWAYARGDLTVRLPGGGVFVIDAKCSLNAFLELQEAGDPHADHEPHRSLPRSAVSRSEAHLVPRHDACSRGGACC